MAKTEQIPKSIEELRGSHVCGEGHLINFEGVESGKNVYNPAPFIYEDRLYLAPRIEPKASEVSEIRHFVQNGSVDSFVYAPDLPVFPMSQDAFVKRINGRWVHGVVKIRPRKDIPGGARAVYTEIRAGDDLREMKTILIGPPGMKDIRPFQLNDGRVGVLTRPESPDGTKGVAYAEFDDLEDITAQGLLAARPIPALASPMEGQHRGGNEAVARPDGTIGYLGHIAAVDLNMRKVYCAETAVLDPVSLEIERERVVSCHMCYPTFEPKSDAHQEVVFPQGIIGTLLFVGLGDAGSGYEDIGEPF